MLGLELAKSYWKPSQPSDTQLEICTQIKCHDMGLNIKFHYSKKKK